MRGFLFCFALVVEQVEAAMPGTRHIDRGSRVEDFVERSRGRHAWGEDSVPASYYYDDAGLARVTLTLPRRDCQDTARQLVGRYGEALRISNQTILVLVIWHDEPNATRIRLVMSTAMCSLNFERLSTYRAHDLEVAGQPQPQ
jgi:hypothetical protein